MSTYRHPSENDARARILTATEAAENGTLASIRERRAHGA
jgi:hypothetical protein